MYDAQLYDFDLLVFPRAPAPDSPTKMGGNWKSWNDGSADNMDPSFQALPEPIFHDGEGGLTFRLPAGQKGFIIQVRGVTQDVSSTFAASSGDCGVLYSEGDGVQEIAEKDISFNLQANVPDTVNVEIFFAYGSGQGPLTYRVLGTSFYPPAPRTTTTTTTSVTTTTATTTTIAAYPLYEEMDFGGCPWNRDRNARDFVRDRGDCIDAAKQLGLWANTFHTLPEGTQGALYGCYVIGQNKGEPNKIFFNGFEMYSIKQTTCCPNILPNTRSICMTKCKPLRNYDMRVCVCVCV